MDNKDIAREWFKIAELDLSSAEFLQKMNPVPVEIICYHCQQSAEKYLKGFLALSGEEIKKTHDLIQLNKMCQKYYEDFKSIEDSCLMLTNYGVNIRYPFPMDINEADMKIAFRNAQKIKDFVLMKSSIAGNENHDDEKGDSASQSSQA
ncbi:HEPN domain-containing protein [bacterium]|nr:HEPN domain-containing protein [bacterium]MCI0611512.1 HEPN domain-containing protein [bacterium]